MMIEDQKIRCYLKKKKKKHLLLCNLIFKKNNILLFDLQSSFKLILQTLNFLQPTTSPSQKKTFRASSARVCSKASCGLASQINKPKTNGT